MNASSANSTYETVLEVCINSLMSQICNYNEDQLKSLVIDEDRLNVMVDSMPQVFLKLMFVLTQLLCSNKKKIFFMF